MIIGNVRSVVIVMRIFLDYFLMSPTPLLQVITNAIYSNQTNRVPMISRFQCVLCIYTFIGIRNFSVFVPKFKIWFCCSSRFAKFFFDFFSIWFLGSSFSSISVPPLVSNSRQPQKLYRLASLV